MAIDWTKTKFPAWFEHNITKRYPLPRLSDEDMIQYVTDIEEVRDLMSLRAYYQAADKRQEELDEIWVSKPMNAAKASYGSNYGYYYGKSEVKRWYVDEHLEKRKAQLKVYCEKQGVEYDESLLGAGSMYMCPLSTSIVRIAKDGKSAKGIWYTIGQKTDLQEDGKFKLFHIVEANDQNYQAGTAYSADTYLTPETDQLWREFGNPTIPMNVHDNTYNWADNYPPMPEPYDTLTLENSYGPEGHPMLKGGI